MKPLGKITLFQRRNPVKRNGMWTFQVDSETCTLVGNFFFVEIPTWYERKWIEICLRWRWEAAGLYKH
jgi:hypothetical protein